MDIQAGIRWLKTAIIASVGGGITASVAAACDPSKYRFPQDLGSGKLWPFFLSGAGLMFVGMLIKSPLGQQVMASYTDAKKQMAENQAAIDQAKANLIKAPK
jgi:hypothetical protein